ncbi:uncharacterized protein B0H18DRAFT_1119836 [Fomitopsis serialis]|uniref:uncharacterized protein n=1 Tax=Fomitopsis serialis TaxID=139415 RepID=UPI0020073934|nr:uncharacterized protein B0H18DRAFT_1119836 [Neoantrodia serialis]KAH9924492.1 hypothetical protein B0H18DRAFT_1119836 [Neoantrodia serialis]
MHDGPMTALALSPPTTVVYVPGKVLLTGGYLVLDPAYSGVVSTSARFYTTVRDLDDEAASVTAAKAD